MLSPELGLESKDDCVLTGRGAGTGVELTPFVASCIESPREIRGRGVGLGLRANSFVAAGFCNAGGCLTGGAPPALMVRG